MLFSIKPSVFQNLEEFWHNFVIFSKKHFLSWNWILIAENTFHAWTFPSIRIVVFNKTHLHHASRPHLSLNCKWHDGFAVKRYCACVRQKFKFSIALAKATVGKFESYHQKFRSEWLLDEKFKKWVEATTNEAYCKRCRIKIHPKLIVIKLHVESKRHKNFETSCPLRNETRRAELMKTAFLVDHNISFREMDHLGQSIAEWTM